MRQPYTRDYWIEETAFIEGQASLPSHERMAAFETYAWMQARFCEKDGFVALAERIVRAVRRGGS